jgi:hypothetical protein
MVWECASGRRLHEAETGSRLTNGSCTMSLNSNHVVLNTMSKVFCDVCLPTVQRRLVVVSHFDNHPIATRHVYMDDNARPHRSRATTPTSKAKP